MNTHNNKHNKPLTLRHLALVPVTLLGLASIIASNGNGISSVAFVSDRDGGGSKLYLMGADGSNPAKIDNVKGGAPAWSPDKERIAFVRNISGESGNSEIFIIDRNGSNERRLTNSPGLDAGPAWAPDGKQIAFESHRSNSPGDIWVINLDTNELTNVTHNPAYRDAEPTWSPDGSEIAFQRHFEDNWEICITAARGGNDRCITNNPAHDEFPAWSPIESESVQSKIAFESTRDNGQSVIYVMNPDGSNLQRLTAQDQTNLFPNWSPLGDSIIFESHRDNNLEVYKMKSDGSEQTNITNNPARDGVPDW